MRTTVTAVLALLTTLVVTLLGATHAGADDGPGDPMLSPDGAQNRSSSAARPTVLPGDTSTDSGDLDITVDVDVLRPGEVVEVPSSRLPAPAPARAPDPGDTGLVLAPLFLGLGMVVVAVMLIRRRNERERRPRS